MAAPLESLLGHIHRLLSSANAAVASDAVLLERFASQGDESAFAVLLARHGPMVYGVCRRVLHDQHDAEDVFQAAFLVLARKAGTLRRPQSLAAWLHGTARYLALKRRCGDARRRQRETECPCPTASSSDPLDELAARELLLILDEEMERLPEKYRLPLLLCGLEGRAQEEAARILGCTPGSLKGRLERGRKQLHLRLTRRGLALSGAMLALGVSQGGSASGFASLTSDTLRAALAFARGDRSGITATVLTLAESGTAHLTMVKVKVTMGFLLALGLTAGASALVQQEPTEKQPENKHAISSPPPGATEKQRGVDRYGDPLPLGAVSRLGTVRFRHGQRIRWVAFSPDGKSIASASTGHSIRVWERATGREVRRITGHQDAVNFVAFTADGKHLVSSSGTYEEHKDASVRLWDAATGREIRRLLPDGQAIEPFAAVALSVDGKTLAAGRGDRFSLVGVPDGRVLGSCRVPDAKLKSIRFSPDGARLAADFDSVGGICLFDVKTTRLLWQNKDQPSDYMYAGLAFAPDGRTLAAAINVKKPMRLLDVATGKEVRRFEGKYNAAAPLLFSGDGRRLFSDGWGRKGIIWDVADAKAIGTLDPSISTARCLVLSPDGKTLAEAGERAIRFWDAATGKMLPEPEAASSMIDGLALSPDGKTLLTASHFDPVAGARIWNLDSGRQQAVLKGRESSRTVAFSPDGRTFAAGCYYGTPVVADTATGRIIRGFEGASQLIDSLAWSPDGKLLVGTGWIAQTIRLWEPGTGRELPPLGTLPNAGGAKCLAFSPDGQYLATGGMDRVIRLWDVAARKEVRQLTGQQGTIWDLAFAPDGQTIAAVTATGKYIFYANGADRAIRLWDVGTGRLRRTLRGPESGSWSVAWSPDGRILATGGEDGEIRLWESATGRERVRLKGHEGPVAALSFTRDGRRLVSGSSDTTALIWDPRTASSPPHPPLPADYVGLWADLAAEDAFRAFQAMCALATASDRTAEWLKERLHSIQPPDPKYLSRLLADLDDAQFSVREKASLELEKLAELAAPTLQETLKTRPSLELRRRVERLLDKLDEQSAEQRRGIRSVELLEQLGTPQARAILKALSSGATGARLTQEAKASLARLAARPRVRP
ncbi:MAG: sigma-70 family RNA polymerase sigma factor [Gemmataceae bacterium]